jgi:hypothetical protein
LNLKNIQETFKEEVSLNFWINTLMRLYRLENFNELRKLNFDVPNHFLAKKFQESNVDYFP